jgi:hypothetical protein
VPLEPLAATAGAGAAPVPESSAVEFCSSVTGLAGDPLE